MLRLAESADVFIEGFRPGAVERWGIDYPAIQAVNPGIVYLSLSGYGQSGPYRDRAGHDLNYMAVGGGLDLNGEQGGAPIPYGLQIADLGGGMLAAIAILAALIGRKGSGEGMYLDVALMDVVLSWVNPLAGGGYFNAQTIAQRGAMALSGALPCYNVYETADGKYLSVGALEAHFWKDFCEVINRPDLIARHLDGGARAEVASVLKGRTQAEWMRLFDEVNACVEPIHDIEGVLQHPHVRQRGYVLEDEGEAIGLASPFVFTRGEGVTPAPELGEHSRQVLESFGLDAADIDPLIESGVVKQP
jgi:crotonobetainyl-CoA:carnitine CoA-transferase CaiB-like acyl-CoA transferase